MTEINNVYDLRTRKQIDRVDTPEGENIQRFMRRWSKTIKDGKFTSICILVMDGDNFCDWGILTDNDLQASLFAHLIDDIKEEIVTEVFGYQEIEE